MAMTVAQLQQRLATLPGTFTLAATDLGIPAVEQLFEQSLPDSTLTLTGAQAVSGQLAAQGTITLTGVGSGAGLSAVVSFSTAGDVVSGIQILVTLDTWQVATGWLTIDVSLLKPMGFDAARLVLVAEPDDTGATAAEAGVEADLPFQTTTGTKALTLRGLEPDAPPSGAPVPTSLWEFEADFTGVTFGDLAQLTSLGTGLSASDFAMPSQVPVLSAIDLTQLRVIYDASSKVVVAASVQVQLADSWPIVTGKCELQALTAAFTITYPTTAPTVAAALTATAEVAGVQATASVTVPALQLLIELDQPLDVDQVFAQYFHSAASIPITIERLTFTLDATVSPAAWYVAFGVGSGQPGGWTLVGDVSLDGVSLEVSGAGTSPQSADLSANFAIGDTASVVLGGSWDETAGWTLSGNTVSPDGLAIGQLLDVFAQEIGAPLPAPLAGLDLTYVGMTVAVNGPSFTFQCKGDFPLGAATADFVVNVAVSGSPLTQHSTGTLALSIPQQDSAPEVMTLIVAFDDDPTKTTFTATWTDTPGLGLADIASYLGVDLTGIPPAVLPVVTTVGFGYDSLGPVLALTVGTQDTSSIWAVTGSGSTRAYYAAISAATSFRLSKLPVVGHELPAAQDVGIDSFGLQAGSAALSAALAQQIVGLVPPPAGVTLPAMAAEGLYLTVTYQAGGSAEQPLTIALTGGDQQPPQQQLQQQASRGELVAASTGAGASAPSGPPAAWLNVQRSFGPVALQRVGVSYSDDTLWLLLDGSLGAGPLQLALQGLGVGFELGGDDPWIPQFRLAGLTVGYSSPPLTIAGSLTNLSPPDGSALILQGGLVIEAEAFTLEAFGYYGDSGGFPSMFLFLEGGAEIGGPPFFFVTGFAGGFGYNSSVTLPAVAQVAGFPMIAALPGTPQYDASALGGDNPSPLTVLNTLTTATPPWITPKLGTFWGAAGITFTTFELVQSQALLIIEVDNDDLSLALLGLSTARFPQEGPNVYAQVELELEARLEPTKGEFWIEALLAPSSFLLDPSCHLTGGFAFCLWFGASPYAGDFVLTLGGYHPAFSPPSYYPTVPRVGFSWQLGGDVSVSGSAYLALTPSAFMLGGELDVRFQSGNLRAWLTAGADVIVHWSPFWFDAHVWVSVGASYRLDLLLTTVTLSVEIGADLELWGPPTGGTVTVDWYVISFTIPFGSGGPDQTSADWSSVTKMLPATGASVSATSGLTTPSGTRSGGSTLNAIAPRAMLQGESRAMLQDESSDAKPWVVRGSSFSFTTATPVPASRVTVGSSYDESFSDLDVRPLAATGLTSTHALTVTDAHDEDVSAAFDIAPVLANVPTSLWGTPQAGQSVPSPDAQLVTGQAVGVTLTVKPPVTGTSAGAVAVDGVLAHDDLDIPAAELPLSPTAAPAGPTASVDASALATVSGTSGISSAAAVTARTGLVAGLATAGVTVAVGANPVSFAQDAGTYLVEEPMLAVMPS